MKTWLRLSHYPEADKPGLIRLQCTDDLQGVIDSRYEAEHWESFTVEQAMLALAHLTVKLSNKAAEKDLFYGIKQGPYETISAYFTRAHSIAANANFRCPGCNHSLNTYLLQSKLAVGLQDTDMKKDVFKNFETLKDVESLREFCIAHEAASRSAQGEHTIGNTATEGNHHPAAEVDDVTEGGSAVGAVRQGAKQGTAPAPTAKPGCPSCGGQHRYSKNHCPARGKNCNYCNIIGHFEKVCRSKMRDSKYNSSK